MTVPLLLSVTELKNQLGGPVVVDGSWHMPASGRDPVKEFKENGHIPGARYFDIESIKDKTSSLPHMMPTAEQFATQVGQLGISNDDHVVVYDTVGLFSAGRVYWMLKAFGHKNVSVLNGGLRAWTAAGFPIEKGEANITAKEYKLPELDQNRIRYYDQVLKIVKEKDSKITIIDARGAPRFTGSAPEPRAGLSSGHMPGAKNVNFMELSDLLSGEVFSDELLVAAFKRAGVDVQQLKETTEPGKEVVLTCGSGVTASALYFALDKLGVKNLAVYDGSWSEYASRPESVIVKD
ncbi:hypothetical protein BGZ99_007889 [Dissophora globulifera]|uniref:Rhodanese domain-containing protein n=1 Tax=Dissophora globulifera TaxID=979702 RepID=A0A9P6RAT5_9FUNG|nr:hypothetical protein BGZ99_007889 [Dissophora globulifera]